MTLRAHSVKTIQKDIKTKSGFKIAAINHLTSNFLKELRNIYTKMYSWLLDNLFWCECVMHNNPFINILVRYISLRACVWGITINIYKGHLTHTRDSHGERPRSAPEVSSGVRPGQKWGLCPFNSASLGILSCCWTRIKAAEQWDQQALFSVSTRPELRAGTMSFAPCWFLDSHERGRQRGKNLIYPLKLERVCIWSNASVPQYITPILDSYLPNNLNHSIISHKNNNWKMM